jgi:hypothetical protein
MLRWYDKRRVHRDLLFDKVIEGEAEALEFFKLQARHENMVKEAFALDSSKINSHDNAMLVSIDTLRKWCALAEKEANFAA